MSSEYDIIFLSFRETNAEENWLELKARFPRAQRVHGVSGIYRAHQAAAHLSRTDSFFLVDGDNKIVPDFDFSCEIAKPKSDTIYVWRCLNPANGLKYGYGAVKLYNKTLLSSESLKFRDLATSVARHYHIIHKVASETHFHATPLEAWRGAFRECVKLQCQLLQNPEDHHSEERLDQWCSKVLPGVSNGSWVLKGAQMGKEYALDNREQPGLVRNFINDFESLDQLWLRQEV